MKPIVYVCLEGQYNHKQGRKLGYKYKTDFLPGWISNSTDASWQGNIEGNKPMKEIMDSLYNLKNMDVYIEGYDIYPKNVEEIYTRVEYIMPYGYCHSLKQRKDFKFLAVSNQKRFKVVLVDPYSTNDVVIKEGAAITFGPRANDEGHEYSLYQAHFNLYDQVCINSWI